MLMKNTRELVSDDILAAALGRDGGGGVHLYKAEIAKFVDTCCAVHAALVQMDAKLMPRPKSLAMFRRIAAQLNERYGRKAHCQHDDVTIHVHFVNRQSSPPEPSVGM